VTPVALAFLWHLHQPLYRLRGERVCFMPWVRLHAIRSYYDMPRVLEEFPAVRPTFNLTATLIEQIRAYERGDSDLFRETGRIPAHDMNETQRAFLVQHFFAAPVETMIAGLPRYAEIHERRERAVRRRGSADAWKELSTADYRDLQVLFDLSWFGFKAREDFPEVQALLDKGRDFTRTDLERVHALEDEILRRVLPLYRAAAAAGRIEISTSPYAHPILPLVIDTEVAREALPQAPLPPRFSAPGDAARQIDDALDLAERELGVRPRGLWPSEGSVSREAIESMSRRGIAWTASDEQVLAMSRMDLPADPGRPWTLAGLPDGPHLVFRDHDLSDRIGFSYAHTDPQRAADGFLATVLDRSRAAAGGGRLVLVALDGENPWDHYPQAGGAFLRALYGALPRFPSIVCETVTEAITRCPERGTIERLHSGSWIHGDFGTWIGGPEKNRAWALLGEVRAHLAGAFEDAPAKGEEARAAWSSLRAAEGSDWFWWLDGQFTTSYRSVFDETFRAHLRQACEALGRPAPEALSWPNISPEPHPEGGIPPESGFVSAPRIDGFEGDYFEWRGAVRLDWGALASRGTMQAARRLFESLRYGISRDGLFCLRIDPDRSAGGRPLAGLGIDLACRVGDDVRRLRLDLDANGDLDKAVVESPHGTGAFPPRVVTASAVARKILELAVPCADVGLAPAVTARLRIRLRTAAGEVQLKEIVLRAPAGFGAPRDGVA
jgi:alpha-amylase/alpha-mannosidase (GH57 family)